MGTSGMRVPFQNLTTKTPRHKDTKKIPPVTLVPWCLCIVVVKVFRSESVALEHLPRLRISVRRGQLGMTARCGRVVLYGVDFGQGHVGGGETGVEADGFEQEGQRLLRLPLHTIEKGQLV